MTNYATTCYGIGRDRKDGDDKTTAATRNPDSKINKGQKCTRLIVVPSTQIKGGQIWVDEDITVALANADTFTITVTTTP
jgi:hypothetical protein